MKMKTDLKPLFWIIIFIAAIGYIGGIIIAGILSIGSSTPPQIPQPVNVVITAIGSVLATNFGALLGISQFTKPDPGSKFKTRTFLRFPVFGEENDKMNFFDKLPVYATYVYFFSLILALIFWGIDKFSENSSPIIINMTSTLIGAVVGVVAVLLNVKQN